VTRGTSSSWDTCSASGRDSYGRRRSRTSS
jgi:hypothetical protein